MTKFNLARLAGLATVGLMTVAACANSGSTTGGETLAADQFFRFPIVDDIGDTDPAQMSAAVDIDIFRNVFSGLYKFDDNLKEVPDLADGDPQISADGLTYTFKIKKGAKFSDGNPVTADDFIFSWNRAAKRQGDYATVFEPVLGYDQVSDAKSGVTEMKGLKKIDANTFSATLSKPAGYWFTEVALWTAWATEKAVIQKNGEDTWYTKPETLIGAGPFKMTAREPKKSATFEPVANYWAGSTGTLKKVVIEVIPDQASQVTKFEAGGYEAIGYANQSPTPEDILRYKNDPAKSKLLTIGPAARTTWIGFGMKSGPFAGNDAGKDGRKAFSLAIDRNALVDVACSKGATCIPATGGVITKGLQGYLGDGSDPNAKVDPATAKSLYKSWDPDGSKIKGLTYTYNTSAANKAIAENLQSQWKQNLGIDVKLDNADRQTFFKTRSKCTYPLFRHSWGADYDHPQDWFDFLFVTGAGSSGSCYSNPQLDDLVKSANQKPLSAALGDYKKAGQILIDQAVTGNLNYGTQPYLVQPYVKGTGGNALYDYYWSEIKILKH